MRLVALTLMLLPAVVGAADPPADRTTQVKVALALNACRCTDPGAHCSDPAFDAKARVAVALAQAREKKDKKTPKPPEVAPAPRPARPTPSADLNPGRYDAQKTFVAATRKDAVFAVGVPLPAGVSGEEYPAGFKGYEPGVYRLFWAAEYDRLAVEGWEPPAPEPVPIALAQPVVYLRPAVCFGAA